MQFRHYAIVSSIDKIEDRNSNISTDNVHDDFAREVRSLKEHYMGKICETGEEYYHSGHRDIRIT